MKERPHDRSRSYAFLIAGLFLATALAGCIGGSDDGSELGPSAGEPGAAGNDGEAPPVIQEATAAWQTGLVPCAGQGQVQLGQNSEGVTHDNVELDPATSEQPFNATLASTIEPVRWGIMFISLDGSTPIPAFEMVESDGDTLEGTVPENAIQARFYSCAGLGHEAAFTVGQGAA